MWTQRCCACGNEPEIRRDEIGSSETSFSRGQPPDFLCRSGLLCKALRGAEMSGRLLRCRHFNFHIESDACLLDPRLIDPSFSACPAPPLAWPRQSMSAYFTNSLTPPTGLGLLTSLPRLGSFSAGQRAARSPERWPAVPPRATREQGGAAWSLPLQIGEMDAKTRNLALLAALSVALLHRHCLDDGSRCFRLGLFAFGVVGIFGAAERHWR